MASIPLHAPLHHVHAAGLQQLPPIGQTKGRPYWPGLVVVVTQQQWQQHERLQEPQQLAYERRRPSTTTRCLLG